MIRFCEKSGKPVKIGKKVVRTNMNRRDFLRLISSTAAIAVAAPAFSKSRTKPNLLIIQTDEHNFRTLGCYRKTLPEAQAYVWGKKAVVATPNIDWLADNGAMCTKFYATTPVCSPSRSAFVSGRYPQNTPVTTNGIPLNDEVITFSEILRRHRYATGYAGATLPATQENGISMARANHNGLRSENSVSPTTAICTTGDTGNSLRIHPQDPESKHEAKRARPPIMLKAPTRNVSPLTSWPTKPLTS
jgi:arylsulfatase A-like enzyme